MCGIAGILNQETSAVDPDRLAAMIARIGHRGPDDRGIWRDGRIGFAHARLSLVDVAQGHQPMHSADGQVTVTFNGEIYNHIELRRDLERRGHRFRTRSDTEVLLCAYQQFGAQCVEHFNGQWAFAIWDRSHQRLMLSRDRFGIRPLYYTQVGGQFLFASEVKALFACPEVPRELDPDGLNQVFTLWAARAPQTVFRGVLQLPPGHNLFVRNGTLQTRRYWHIEFSQVTEKTPDEQCEHVAALFADATRLRLRADVPVGAYVSGGLDSALTAVWAQRYVGPQLRTFSIAFDDPEFDERAHQATVVDQLGTEHEMLCCRHADIATAFPRVVWHAETPVLRTAAAPLFLLSRMVRDAGIKAVLTGEGADEVFAGYGIFREAKVRRFLSRNPDSAMRAALFDSLYHYLPHLRAQSTALRKAFFRTRKENLDDPFVSHLPRWGMTAQLKRLIRPDFLPQTRHAEALDRLRGELPPAFSQWPPLCQAQYLEATILMPGYILSTQGDRVAMAHAVEGRFPFLDHRLAEFAAQLPPRMKLCGLNEKHIIKRAFRGDVPAAVSQRTKQPFRAPDAAAFFYSANGTALAPYVDDLLSPTRVARAGVFHPAAVANLLDKLRTRVRIGTRDNMALVAVLSTQILVDQFLHEAAPPPPIPPQASGVVPSIDFPESGEVFHDERI